MTLILPTMPGITWPRDVSSGQFDTNIQTSVSGKISAYPNKINPTRTYTISISGLDSSGNNPALVNNSLQTLQGFFNQCYGRALPFQYNDADDNAVTAQQFGTGDGTTASFQLLRTLGGFVEQVFAPTNITAAYSSVVAASFANNSLVIKDPVTPANNYSGPLITAGVFNKFTYSRASTATFVGSNGLIQTAAANVPRIEYDPVTLAVKGYLHEGARTNLIVYSENLPSAWSQINITFASVSIAAPDGNISAYILKENTALGAHFSNQAFTKAASSLQYVASVWVKAKERTKGWLRTTDQSGNGAVLAFDAGAGTISAPTLDGTGFTATRSKIAAFPNGWFRLELGFTTNSTLSLDVELWLLDGSGASNYTGDGASGMYYWGAQLEQAGAASSYIPTAAVTVTRAADALSLPNTLFNLTSAAGTLYIKNSWQGGTAVDNSDRVALSISNDGTSYGFIYNRNAVSGAYLQNAGAAQAALQDAAILDGVFAKSAFAFAANDFSYVQNGGTPQTSGTGTVPAFTVLAVGGIGSAGSAQLFGTIPELMFIGQRIANAAEQALTGNSYLSGIGVPHVYLGGIELNPAFYNISSTGVVTFTVPPLAGAAITWTGTYNWLCHWDSDSLDLSNFMSGFYEAKKLSFTTRIL